MKLITILFPLVAFISAGCCFNPESEKEQLIQTRAQQRRIIEIQSSQILANRRANRNTILCRDGLLVSKDQFCLRCRDNLKFDEQSGVLKEDSLCSECSSALIYIRCEKFFEAHEELIRIPPPGPYYF